MRFYYYIIILLLAIQSAIFCQGFNVSKTGIQTFYFKDPQNRNQILFTSNALVETFNGLANDVWGEVSFNPSEVQNTIKGRIFVSVNSIKTGIDLRDENLYGSQWLDAEKYPIISFTVEKAQEVIILDDNKIRLSLTGPFECHGKTKVIILDATLTLLEESGLTKKRMPGDLISFVSEFEINLSDFAIRNIFLPDRIADKIEIAVNIVGTNKKPE
jgi:polyisoprenoid-binding protein YceI